ncbi:uncharacterized protein LOC110037329 isoform X2 [Phalaenopsis equestris]|uniref:uncharacterized protein LOC110037329 isoform X2 n=1 Tax=Phalaenopsis equestris TaxID=78828 RepID=UPI0009E5F88B|nr:uncharacterized protein LOC110037329 isoform X2 [Phalaenopsis equestris]
MAELSIMASAVFSLAPFYQEQTACRSSKEISTTLPGYGNRSEFLKSTSVLVGFPPVEEKLLPKNLFSRYNQPHRSIPMVEKPVLIDMQDAHPDSVLFSFGIAEQPARQEKILKLLFSGYNEEDGIDTSLLSDLMGLKTVAIDTRDMFSRYEVEAHDSDHLLRSASQFHIPIPLADCSNGAHIAVHPYDRMLLSRVESEIKDLLSVASEYNILKGFTTSNKSSMVVPYFTRSRGGHARNNSQGSVLSNQTVAPSKSSENIKLKPSPKKKQGKNAVKERDHHEKSYFRACEILLSVVINTKSSHTVILSLKKSAPEITQLLSQFSASIAGTGLAVLLSVACKTPAGRMPFNSAKVLNVGVGIGFFWLSWAVNGLRETISEISRSSQKIKLTEEEIIGRVDGSVNEVLFKALALLAMVFLRFA